MPSSIKLGEKALDLLKNNYTITLAYYELGNILWKYKDKLDIGTVFNALSSALSFVVKLDKEILEEAIKKNLTIQPISLQLKE